MSTADRVKDENYLRSEINPKYRRMQDEFIYKGIPWVSWTSLERIQTIESKEFVWRSTDVLIATFTKSGTTLLEEMVWLLTNKADFETAKKFRVFARVPFLEENYKTLYPGEIVPLYPLEYIPNMTEDKPRLLKSHLPYRHLKNAVDHTPGLKTIVCLRNPKDVMVSYYHFYQGTEDHGPFEGSWNEFFEMWMDGWIVGGDWLEVIAEWWQKSNQSNVLFVFYEDLVQQPLRSLRKVADFLDIPHFQNDVEPHLDDIVKHCSFESMKRNPMTNFTDTSLGFAPNFQFMRKGIVGDWKNWFTVAQNETFDKIYVSALMKLGLSEFIRFE